MMQKNAITLKQLRALAAIQEEGSLTAASERLNVTTPAVSTQLKTLESNLGVELLVRDSRGQMEITSAGSEVLTTIGDIESVLERCYRRVESLKEGRSGFVSLGVISTAKYFAPKLVAEARVALPGFDIEMVIGNREAILASLSRNEFDLTIMGRPPREPYVHAEALADNPHIIIAPPSHPLSSKKNVTASDLLAETFLTRERGSGTRILMERFLDRICDGQPYDTYELGTNETIKQAVMAGLGIALISEHTVMAELVEGRLTTIQYKGLPIIRQWFLVNRNDRTMSPAAQRFREFILDLGGSYLPTIVGINKPNG